jgi:predicted phage-related endonuclease
MAGSLIMTVGVNKQVRRAFIGGSDARIILGDDDVALLRLWREKRGEVEPADLSDNLLVQLGQATEALNRRWFERNTGEAVIDVQRHVYPDSARIRRPPLPNGAIRILPNG